MQAGVGRFHAEGRSRVERASLLYFHISSWTFLFVRDSYCRWRYRHMGRMIIQNGLALLISPFNQHLVCPKSLRTGAILQLRPLSRPVSQ